MRLHESSAKCRTASGKNLLAQSLVVRSRAEVARELAGLRRLSALSPPAINALASEITIRRLNKRALIYSEGQVGENMYFVLSGIARLTCENRKRRSALLEVLAPGDIIGLPVLLPDVRHRLRCETVTRCELGVISDRALVEDVLGMQLARFSLGLKLMVSRWWEMLVRQSHFVEQTMAERVIITLLDLGAKCGVRDERGTILNAPLSQQDLADLAGASRPKVNLVLRGLAERGALIQDRRRIIILPDRLELALRLSSA